MTKALNPRFWAFPVKDGKTPIEALDENSERMGTAFIVNGRYQSVANFIRYGFKYDNLQRELKRGRIWRICVGASAHTTKFVGLYYDPHQVTHNQQPTTKLCRSISTYY